jgi:hypothetical protein
VPFEVDAFPPLSFRKPTRAAISCTAEDQRGWKGEEGEDLAGHLPQMGREGVLRDLNQRERRVFLSQ